VLARVFIIASFLYYYFAYNAKYILGLAIFAISFSRTYCKTLQNPYWVYIACETSQIITLATFLGYLHFRVGIYNSACFGKTPFYAKQGWIVEQHNGLFCARVGSIFNARYRP